jgi:hypothetical protein
MYRPILVEIATILELERYIYLNMEQMFSPYSSL